MSERQSSVRRALELVRSAARSDYLGFADQGNASLDEAALKLACLIEGGVAVPDRDGRLCDGRQACEYCNGVEQHAGGCLVIRSLRQGAIGDTVAERTAWNVAQHWAARARSAERTCEHLFAALEHVVRDPQVARHAGWQDDARKALIAARGDVG